MLKILQHHQISAAAELELVGRRLYNCLFPFPKLSEINPCNHLTMFVQ